MKVFNILTHYISLLGIASIMMLSLGSCSEKTNPEEDKPEVEESLTLSVNPSAVTFEADDETSRTVNVETNASEWSHASEIEWIKVSVDSENPNVLVITADANPEKKSRNGVITIKAVKDQDEQEAVIKVKQEGKKNEQKPGCVYFEDPVFKEYILGYFDVDHDGEISEKEALNIKELDCGSLETSALFSSLRGVEEFKNLTVLYCEGNLLTSLDLSGLSKLEFIDCNHNKLKSLKIDGCSALTALHCHFNEIESLNINTECPLVKFINCGNNAISSLDVSGMKDLEYLACESNKMKDLNVKGCEKLATLACHKNELSKLDIEGLSAIYNLMCSKNQIEKLDVSHLAGLVQLECDENYLEGTLDLTHNPELAVLFCNGNRIDDLKLENCPKITTLDCSETKISGIHVSHMTELKNLNCSVNFLTDGLDVSSNLLLKKLYCSNAHLSVLEVASNVELVELICDDNSLKTLDVSNNLNLEKLHAMGNPLESLFMAEGQSISDLKLDDVSIIERR